MGGYSKFAQQFIASSKRPFFLQVNYPDAHRPFIKSVGWLPKEPLEPLDVDVLPFIGINHPELRQQSADYYNCMMRLDSYVETYYVSWTSRARAVKPSWFTLEIMEQTS